MPTLKLPTEHNDPLGPLASVRREVAPGEVYSLLDPPIGFFPFCEIGNGNQFGYYWPIGREDGPPLVACTNHDTGSIVPVNSSIEGLLACELARSDDDELEPGADFQELARQSLGREPALHNVRGVHYREFATLLSFDPASAFYLCAVADERLADGELDAAEAHYRKALNQLPEYVAAHAGLVMVMRRRQRTEEAVFHLWRSMIEPDVFCGAAFWADMALPGTFHADWGSKAMGWLRRMKHVAPYRDDPFVRRIDELNSHCGGDVGSDIATLLQIVEAYAVVGDYSNAALVWQLAGRFDSLRPVGQREQDAFAPRSYGRRLAELWRSAGYSRRAALVENMITSLDGHA